VNLKSLQLGCELKQEYILNLAKKLSLMSEGYADKTAYQKVELELDRLRTVEDLVSSKVIFKRRLNLFTAELSKKLNSNH